MNSEEAYGRFVETFESSLYKTQMESKEAVSSIWYA